MKKKMFVGAFALSVLGIMTLGSCTKDWDCECTMGSGSTQIVTHETIEASTLSQASDKCESKDESTYGSCKLKP